MGARHLKNAAPPRISSYVPINISDFLFVEKIFARCLFLFSRGFVIVYTAAFIQSGTCFRFGVRLDSLFDSPWNLFFSSRLCSRIWLGQCNLYTGRSGSAEKKETPSPNHCPIHGGGHCPVHGENSGLMHLMLFISFCLALEFVQN